MSKKRLLAFVIDYFIILSISAIIAFLVQSSGIMFTICCSLLISAILNKDSIRGQSLGKKCLSIQIIDFKTRKDASISKCIMRNLTLFLWPIELIAIFINPNRRIGDMIAGTEVIENVNTAYNISKKEIQKFIIYVIIIALLLSLPIFFIIQQSPSTLLLFNQI